MWNASRSAGHVGEERRGEGARTTIPPSEQSVAEQSPSRTIDSRDERNARLAPIWPATIPATVIAVACTYTRALVGQRLPGPPAREHGGEDAKQASPARPSKRPHEAVHPREHVPVEEPLAAPPRSPPIMPRSGALDPEGDRREHVRAEVDREHLHHRERQRDRAEAEAPREERDQLADVRAKW